MPGYVQYPPWFYKKGGGTGPVEPDQWANFDGVGGCIYANMTQVVTTFPFSIEGWAVTPTPGAANQQICGYCTQTEVDYWSIGFALTTNNLQVGRRGSLAASTVTEVGPPPSSGWHKYTVEFVSDTAYKVYIDGVLTYDLTGQPTQGVRTLDRFAIGVLRFGSPAWYFAGDIAQCRAIDGSTVIGSWPLAGDALDYSGNGQTGIVVPTVIFQP